MYVLATKIVNIRLANKIAFVLLLFIALPSLLIAQKKDSVLVNSYVLTIKPLDKEKQFFKRQKIKFEHRFNDSSQVRSRLHQIIKDLHSKAFLTASVDTFFQDSSHFTAYLFVGEKYEWASLANGNVAPAFLAAIGFKERLYRNQPFFYKEVVQLQEKLLTYLENHGYPFSKVFIDSVRIAAGEISARIYYDKGPLILFDEINIIGKTNNPKRKKKKKKVRITKGFMSSYLGIRKGKLYSEKLVLKLQSRMSVLRYLTMYQTPTIIFRDNKAELNLFLMDRPSSKIDVLFGILPNKPSTPAGEQTFDFTGKIDIDLINPVGTGKRLQLKWQQIKAGTSDLLVGFKWPYLLKTPLGIDFAFMLYKRDSSYIDVIVDVGLQYLFNGSSYIKAFWLNTNTFLINVNTESILANKRLPSMLDIDKTSFGLEFYYDNLDYKYNPHSGFETKIVASFAIKNIRKNNSIQELIDPIDSFDFSSLYDTITLNTFQYRFVVEHSHFFQLWKWSTLMTRINSGLIVSKDPIYENETFRIGGNRRLRGFDEESILATWYNVLSLEWRFLFGRNSYAYVFGDFSYLQKKSIGVSFDDFPIGFGLGVALETKVGVFGLTYALGTQQGNPVSFNNGKVHFGYVYSF